MRVSSRSTSLRPKTRWMGAEGGLLVGCRAAASAVSP